MDLRTWRKRSEVSVGDFASQVGVAESTLTAYENGTRRPRADVAQRIEHATNGAISAAALMGLDQPSPRPAGRSLREEAEAFVGAQTIVVEVAVTDVQAQLFHDAGTNIEAVARDGAERAVKEAAAQAWEASNRDAIDAYNTWVGKHGTLAEQLGLI